MDPLTVPFQDEIKYTERNIAVREKINIKVFSQSKYDSIHCSNNIPVLEIKLSE